jgi:hypothetical protein
MCWYSAEHAGHILEAEVGQRLVVRKVHGSNLGRAGNRLGETAAHAGLSHRPDEGAVSILGARGTRVGHAGGKRSRFPYDE